MMAKALKTNVDYSSIDDLSLPHPSSSSFYREGNEVSLERCNSDSNLNILSPQEWSTLVVDKRKCWLSGLDETDNGRLCVEWDIKEDVGGQDWIGLFPWGMFGINKHNNF